MSPGTQSDPQPALLLEADRIARHLIGESATDAERARYAVAVDRAAAPLDVTSLRLWALMLRRPRLFGLIDAGLALAEPAGPIRQRLLVMLAILEASPAHTALFVPPTDGRVSPRALITGVLGGTARATVGLPLVLLLRRVAR